MTGPRKFGTFSGVFTPSILTILGVIMYLRLPSIVGQAGLLTALGIIAVAHVISVTTGLSVASVATDRKVRGGGTYYMLSRSLGLPIGGTLGIALFVGLSFAVSLYIIGFAESFLGFWGIEPTITAIRTVGVVVLLLVTLVTLVSTSLALRAQFFILAAIALSLLSIVLGVGRHELGPETTAATVPGALPAAASFIVLFGIFFPAVTGFEAGVSMSGDLRDPKKSIPVGTIAAIMVGFAVYIALAAFLALTVDAGQLATNPRVLLDISLASPLVLAGVWGATISSALGSVLAAPRILQATSIDRITPPFFGRGYGRDNEPRHALLLTVAIALVGILIGELDVIARIVSMFFITAYGFLNLACAIESWASPDFRPSFRVPRAVPVLGALACLIVMIQLDLVAMIGATLVLGALYFYLTRRQLRLETGDAWSGFWTSVARAALHRLDRRGAHQRNWRPNLLAFALPGAPRDQIFDLARQLAGPRGMLTAVDVVPGAERGTIRRDGRPAGNGGDGYGVFTRTVESRDPYASVTEMARYHGFAGIEPNALLLHWPDDPDADFAAMLERLADVDQNLLLLATSVQAAARPPRIDVWWWGEPASALLQLSLVRALSTGDAWRDVRLRVLTAMESGVGVGVERRMAALLDDMRLDAEIRVVHGATAQPVTDVVTSESAGADLVLLDATPLTKRSRVPDAADFDAVRSRLHAVLFTLPAASFGSAVAGAAATRTATRRAAAAASTASVAAVRPVPELRLPTDAALAAAVRDIHEALGRIADNAAGGPLNEAYARTAALLERAHAQVDDGMAAAADAAGRGRTRTERAVRKEYGDLLYQSRRLLAGHREHELPEQAACLAEFADRLLAGVEALPDEAAATVDVTLDRAAFRIEDGDGVRLRAFKLFKRAVAPRSRRLRMSVPLRELVRRHVLDAAAVVERAERDCITDAVAAVNDVQALLTAARDGLERVRCTATGTAMSLEPCSTSGTCCASRRRRCRSGPAPPRCACARKPRARCGRWRTVSPVTSSTSMRPGALASMARRGGQRTPRPCGRGHCPSPGRRRRLCCWRASSWSCRCSPCATASAPLSTAPANGCDSTCRTVSSPACARCAPPSRISLAPLPPTPARSSRASSSGGPSSRPSRSSMNCARSCANPPTNCRNASRRSRRPHRSSSPAARPTTSRSSASLCDRSSTTTSTPSSSARRRSGCSRYPTCTHAPRTSRRTPCASPRSASATPRMTTRPAGRTCWTMHCVASTAPSASSPPSWTNSTRS
jgi:amino acid transporter